MLKDFRGTEIKPGSKVIYTRSKGGGYRASGRHSQVLVEATVTRIVWDEKSFRIKLAVPRRDGHYSQGWAIVKNLNKIAVIG